MAQQGYTWRNARPRSTFRLPRHEHIGRWVSIAIVMAVVFHLGVLIGLKRMPVFMSELADLVTIETGPVQVQTPVEMDMTLLPEPVPEALPEPPAEAASLLEEIDMLELLPENTELDMRPDVTEPEFAVKMEAPAMKGDALADSLEPVAGPQFNEDLPDIGRTEEIFQPVAAGQIVIDAGVQDADLLDPDKFTEDLTQKGSEGLADKGALDKFTPLGDMANLSGNALEKATGMIGSDLLFEFNKDTLRESARFSLLKVALLIDKNPELNCWIEGHTDLIGGDAFNQELSLRRAQAVKDWLVQSMQIDPARLVVTGYGKKSPIISEGDQNAQALNRRVEIKMRRGFPEVEQSQPLPQVPKIDEQPAPPQPPNAVPVEEPKAPRAEPVQDPPAPRALPVDPARAVPVE